MFAGLKKIHEAKPLLINDCIDYRDEDNLDTWLLKKLGGALLKINWTN